MPSKNFPARFAGFDEKWNAEQASVEVDGALKRISLYLSSVAGGNVDLLDNSVGTDQIRDGSITDSKLALSQMASLPLSDQARKINVSFTAPTDTLIGTDSDPRLRFVSGIDGSGMGQGVQRFQIGAGFTMTPFLVKGTGSSTTIHATYGALLLGIPHSLNRIPEGLTWQGINPQVLIHSQSNPDTPAAAAAWADGTTVDLTAARLRFMPLLAGDKDDMDDLLRHYYDFTPPTNYGPTTAYDTTARNPGKSFPEWLSERMVTTSTTYAGLIYLSQVGWGYALESGKEDPIPMPDGGMWSSVGPGPNSVNASTNAYLCGLIAENRLTLKSGTIDWVMG